MAVGVVFNTAMARPDSALALAALYSVGRGEPRVGAVCVTGAGLDTAIFCDAVSQFYRPGMRGGNDALAVGLDVVEPMPADPAMIGAALARKRADDTPQYARTIARVADTSHAPSALRNGVTWTEEADIVLSAPATSLARALAIQGAAELYAARVRRLIVVEAGVRGTDAAAFNAVVARWPTPIEFLAADVGAALALDTAALDTAFEWAPAHPVVDAYRAYRPTPYTLPADDLAAVWRVANPQSPLLSATAEGSLTMTAGGELGFTAGGGRVQRLVANGATRGDLAAALTAAAGRRTVPSGGRGIPR